MGRVVEYVRGGGVDGDGAGFGVRVWFSACRMEDMVNTGSTEWNGGRVCLFTSMQLQRLELRCNIFAAHLDYLFSELLESGFGFRPGHVSEIYR